MTPRAKRVGRPTKREQEARDGPQGTALRCLAHPARRRILVLLASSPKTVSALCEHFSVSRPMVSKHLRMLRRAHLVWSQPYGRHRLYGVHSTTLARDALQIAQRAEGYDREFTKLVQHLARQAKMDG